MPTQAYHPQYCNLAWERSNQVDLPLKTPDSQHTADHWCHQLQAPCAMVTESCHIL